MINDKKYWSSVYNSKTITSTPSDFALSVVDSMGNDYKKLLEFGYGNGRDLMFFNNIGYDVSGIELADTIKLDNIKDDKLINGSFCEMQSFDKDYDIVYSRFTLHSISYEDETAALMCAYNYLKPGGTLFIEARTIFDDFCGKGEHISKYEWVYEDHYRRFIEPGDLISKLLNMGFLTTEIYINKGFAIYNDQDPVCIRIKAIKK